MFSILSGAPIGTVQPVRVTVKRSLLRRTQERGTSETEDVPELTDSHEP
jgi:hypothetical protein